MYIVGSGVAGSCATYAAVQSGLQLDVFTSGDPVPDGLDQHSARRLYSQSSRPIARAVSGAAAADEVHCLGGGSNFWAGWLVPPLATEVSPRERHAIKSQLAAAGRFLGSSDTLEADPLLLSAIVEGLRAEGVVVDFMGSASLSRFGMTQPKRLWSSGVASEFASAPAARIRTGTEIRGLEYSNGRITALLTEHERLWIDPVRPVIIAAGVRGTIELLRSIEAIPRTIELGGHGHSSIRYLLTNGSHRFRSQRILVRGVVDDVHWHLQISLDQGDPATLKVVGVLELATGFLAITERSGRLFSAGRGMQQSREWDALDDAMDTVVKVVATCMAATPVPVSHEGHPISARPGQSVWADGGRRWPRVVVPSAGLGPSHIDVVSCVPNIPNLRVLSPLGFSRPGSHNSGLALAAYAFDMVADAA